jgi:hypothetical protein
MKKEMKPGDMFNAFQKKRAMGKIKNKKKAKKMTQAEDNAYDKAHNQKEGSAKDIAQDKRNGIKDKKKKKSGLRPASVVVADEQNASHQYYKKGKKKNKTKKKLDLVKGIKDTAKGAYSEGKYLLGKVGEGAKLMGNMGKASLRAITGGDLRARFPKKTKNKARCKQHSKMGCKSCSK